MIRLLHTSDWHLGRQFHGVSLLADQAEALAQLLAVVKQQQVDAVLIAGDIYDRAVPPADAVALLDTTLNTLVHELNVQVIMISGNHDSAKRLGFARQSLQQAGVHLITSLEQLYQPVVLSKAGVQVKVWGIAYSDTESVYHFALQQSVDTKNKPPVLHTATERQQPSQPKVAIIQPPPTDKAAQLDLWADTDQPRNDIDDNPIHTNTDMDTNTICINNQQQAYDYLLEQIKPQRQAQKIPTFNLLMAHCFLAGSNVSESERPLSVGGSEQVASSVFTGFDYVALGHLHAPQYKGSEHIRYSGSLLKYSFSEVAHNKGVMLLDFTDKGLTRLHHVDIIPKHDMRVVEGFMADIIANTADHNDDYVLVRLLDKHAIIDAIGKLRVCYPNVMALEKVGINQVGQLAKETGLDTLTRAPLALFTDFFTQMTKEPLTDEQNQHLVAVLDTLAATE